MRLGFEEDADGNSSPVGVEDFDMEEVYRRLDGDTEPESPQKDAVRVALRAIIDASPVPMILNDSQQVVTFLNPAFVDVFGYSLDDIPSLAAWRILAYPDPAYRARILSAWAAEFEGVASTGRPFAPIEISISCPIAIERLI